MYCDSLQFSQENCFSTFFKFRVPKITTTKAIIWIFLIYIRLNLHNRKKKVFFPSFIILSLNRAHNTMSLNLTSSFYHKHYIYKYIFFVTFYSLVMISFYFFLFFTFNTHKRNEKIIFFVPLLVPFFSKKLVVHKFLYISFSVLKHTTYEYFTFRLHI